MWEALLDLVQEAQRQGVHYMLIALLALSGAFYVLKAMVDYLEQILNVEVPSGSMMSQAIFDFADAHPIFFLGTNFGLGIAIGYLFLIWKDIQEWARQMRQALLDRSLNAYHPLDEEGGPSAARESGGNEASANVGLISATTGLPTLDIEAAGRPAPGQSPMSTPMSTSRSEASEGTLTARERRKTFEETTRELNLVTGKCEELEIKTRVLYRKTSSPAALEARAELKQLQAQRDELRALVSGMSGTDLRKTKPAKPTLIGRVIKSALFQILARSANGIFSVAVYFADLVSDLQVAFLLVKTGNFEWAAYSIVLLVLQFFVVHMRVLPYLASTFGSRNPFYLAFAFLGFPVGLLVLDGLMILEPFGLLAILPFPDWLRQFLPAYKATRIIAEVVIESLPQCFLQSYIYVVVLQHQKAGIASASELAMVPFASVLPTSILISTIAMLKMWIEVVNGAQAAGLTIQAKAIQLWEVGAGLPLDALKKGAIVEWSCPYRLEGPEISPLLDALGRNSSLVHLDLSRSGLTWSSSTATGAPLVDNMCQSGAVLSSLKSLIISRASRFNIPVAQLRQGGDAAMVALQAAPFFSPSGPWREELIFIGQLLRKNTQVGAVDLAEEAARERVVAMLVAARSGKLKRDVWMQQLCQLMADGMTRRGHLISLINAQALHDVGFTAAELLSSGFVLAELRVGGFDAGGLRAAGLKATVLGAAGFTAAELKTGGFSCRELRGAGFTPLEMKVGGFTALQLKDVGLSAAELKENSFSAEELREGTFPCAVLKALFSATELRM